MKRLFCLFILSIAMGGCSKTVETTSDLSDSKLPWGQPAEWEKSMPIAPGVKF